MRKIHLFIILLLLLFNYTPAYAADACAISIPQSISQGSPATITVTPYFNPDTISLVVPGISVPSQPSNLPVTFTLTGTQTSTIPPGIITITANLSKNGSPVGSCSGTTTITAVNPSLFLTGIPTPTGVINYYTNPCVQYKDSYICPTAIGTINTSPIAFIEKVFAYILSLSGFVALLLLIQSGYQILTSQGDQEALKTARERLTAVVVGLLFIVFSLVVLQTIGVDILHLPGLTP